MFYGGKGGGSSFKQTPDNLRSVDTFEGVLGVGIGPMKGPTRGLKSVKIDGTAIENETGELNFGDFVVTIGDGDPAKFPQPVQLKLGTGAAPTQVGVSITNPNGPGDVAPTGPGPWVTRTLSNTGANFIDLRFILQALFRQDKKGIYEETLTLEINMKPVGSSTWVNPTLTQPSGTYNEQGGTKTDLFRQYIPRSYYDNAGNWAQGTPNYQIKGKTTSAAVYELRIAVPNEGAYANTAWDIRVRLLERESYVGGESGENQEKRTVSWESMAAVYGNTLGTHEDWRGLAWLQLYGKASDQLTGVPEIEGEWDTKIVSVPPSSVYNPDTRSYLPVIWDGSWSKAFTSDPAWVINDAISDSLSGLSLIASGSYLNKWDALEASKWFSQPVADGKGGLEPRFSLNLAISQPQKAEEFIRYMAGAVGALAWDQGDGEWRMKCDKPDNPVDIFTLDNIEGEFVYSHTDVDTRFNDIIGQFKNAEMDYRQDAVHLYDNPSIAQIGRKPTTIALVGCTGRQEAMRRVKLRLRTTINENKIVTFTTNRRGRNVDQLSTILIADGDLGDQAKRTTGRVVSIAPDRKSITVRDPLRLEIGIDYNLKFAIPNAGYASETPTQPASIDWTKPTVVRTRAITNSAGQRGNVRILYFAEALPADVADHLVIALEAAGLPTLPRMYRVTNIVPQDDGEKISISAINVDTGKWDAADNVSNEDTVFQDLRGPVPMPLAPDGGQVLSLRVGPAEQGKSIFLGVNWVRPAGAFISGFRVDYKINGGAIQNPVPRTQDTNFELVNPTAAGTYEFSIYTLDRRGGVSKPLVASIEVTQAFINASHINYIDGTPVEELQPAESGAQITRAISLSSTAHAFILKDDGTMIGGQTPFYIQATVTQALLNVTTLADYTLNVTGGVTATLDNDPNSVTRGRVVITNVTAPGIITVTANVGGVSLPATFTVTTKGVLADSNAVGADQIYIGAVTSAANFTAPDTMIPSYEQTLIESPFFSVGDDQYGKAILIVSFTHDSTAVKDSWANIRTYVDLNDGNGYQMLRSSIQGMQTSDGDTKWAMPTAFSFSVSSVNPVRVKVTAQGVQVNGSGNVTGSTARNTQVNVFKGQR